MGFITNKEKHLAMECDHPGCLAYARADDDGSFSAAGKLGWRVMELTTGMLADLCPLHAGKVKQQKGLVMP